MSDIRQWLEELGLGQYADAFEENEIERNILSDVTDQTLKDIGISVAGHRIRILKPKRRADGQVYTTLSQTSLRSISIGEKIGSLREEMQEVIPQDVQ